MEEAEVVRVVAELPGVDVLTASEAGGAPEIAWGDSFFYYDPDRDRDERAMPFATIVTNDYPGFDTASDLDRDGVFRVNLHVGRDEFETLLGYPPAELDAHRDGVDFAAPDRVIPHPLYGPQGWVCVVSPGPATDGEVRRLAALAHEHDRRRHERAAGG